MQYVDSGTLLAGVEPSQSKVTRSLLEIGSKISAFGERIHGITPCAGQRNNPLLQLQGRLGGHQSVAADQEPLCFEQRNPRLDIRDGHWAAAFQCGSNEVVALESGLALA